MHFHSVLVRITAFNIPLSFLVFYILYKSEISSTGAIGSNSWLGWIFYLAILSMIAPILVKENIRHVIYKKYFLSGTLFLKIINIFGVILASYLAKSLLT